MGVFSHEGSRVISFLRPAGPTSAVLSSYASAGSSGVLSLPPETKSENDGPAFSLSLKVVWRRGVVGELLVADGEGSVVA